jgi:hypothetical protein
MLITVLFEFDMDRRVQVALMATVLLSGGARYLYNNGGFVPHREGGLQVAQERGALEQCLYAAQMMHDVQWAAACTTQVDADDSAECDLPDAKAAVVNAALDDAQALCMAESRGR